MTERSIIESDDMVLAYLEGRKTQIRIPVNPQPKPYVGGCHPKHKPIHDAPYIDAYCGKPMTAENPRGMGDEWYWWAEDNRLGPFVGKSPFGAPGDTVWVKECWGLTAAENREAFEIHEVLRGQADLLYRDLKMNIHYRATEKRADMYWRPSSQMPHWASRITLKVIHVCVERVQSLNEADAIAEGVDAIPSAPAALTHRTSFAGLWDSIYAKKGFGWESNPWVWACEVKTK